MARPQRRKTRSFGTPERELARGRDFTHDLEILIGDWCMHGGFCNALTANDLIREDEPITAEDFARAVLSAEGMNPDYEPKWFKQMCQSFTHRYGPSVRPSDFKPSLT